MSTATERIMRQRGDFHCVHEPFIHYYYLEKAARKLAHYEVPAKTPIAYGDVRRQLLSDAGRRPTFFKDMAYYVTPEICDDVDFLTRISHVFLIRDPRKAIMSFHRLDPDFLSPELGFAGQLELANAIAEQTGAPPCVMRAEDIQHAPQKVLRAVWHKLGIQDCAHAFEWSDDQVPEDWRHVSGWHGQAIASTGIRAPSEADDPEDVERRFEQLCTVAPRMKEIFEEHYPAYEALSAHALTG